MRILDSEQARRFVAVERFGPQPMDRMENEAAGHTLRVQLRGASWTSIPSLVTQVIEAVGPCRWWVLHLAEGPEQWSGGPLHLYYQLRRGAGERRLLQEAPFHYFCAFEREELQSVLTLAVLNLWDAHLVTDLEYGRLFLSHSEWLSVWSADSLDKLASKLKEAGINEW